MNSDPKESQPPSSQRKISQTELVTQLDKVAADIGVVDERLQQQVAGESKAAQRIAQAEELAHNLIEEAKERASAEGAIIIAAAADEARAATIREGQLTSREGGIQRLIEFAPELRQAGIAILAYFSEVLKQKYPDREMAVRIEQFGTKVRMTIHSPLGMRDVVERDLAAYGEVVVGHADPASLLQNEFDVMRLQNKLDLAKVELDFEKRVSTLVLANSNGRVASLEHQLERLHDAIALSLVPRESSLSSMAVLLERYSSNELISQALRLLSDQLAAPIAQANREAIENAAETLRDRDPTVLRRVYDIFSATGAGAAGTLLASWIERLLK